MRIEPIEKEEVIEVPPPKKIHKYKMSVHSYSDRPVLMKLLWQLDENAIMYPTSNWDFKIKTTLTPVDMTRIIANCGFICRYRKILLW